MENTPTPPRSPWIAAILNFIFPGLGYMYVGSKRQIFRVGLLLSSVLVFIGILAGGNNVENGTGPTGSESAGLLIFMGAFISASVFAIDAYRDGEEKRSQASNLH